jgi:hypothetical protein
LKSPDPPLGFALPRAVGATRALNPQLSETLMNNGTTEPNLGAGRATARGTTNDDALAQTKKELMQAEVRLAKARTTVVTAEIDVKTLTAKLRALAK